MMAILLRFSSHVLWSHVDHKLLVGGTDRKEKKVGKNEFP